MIRAPLTRFIVAALIIDLEQLLSATAIVRNIDPQLSSAVHFAARVERRVVELIALVILLQKARESAGCETRESSAICGRGQ